MGLKFHFLKYKKKNFWENIRNYFREKIKARSGKCTGKPYILLLDTSLEESTLCNCLNSLIETYAIFSIQITASGHPQTHKHKRTHNNLAEVLSCVLNTYLCSDMIKTSCRLVVTAQPNRLVILAKCSGVLFQTKWFRIQVSLKSMKFKISRLFWAKRSLTFKIITECRFTLNAYVKW